MLFRTSSIGIGKYISFQHSHIVPQLVFGLDKMKLKHPSYPKPDTINFPECSTRKIFLGEIARNDTVRIAVMTTPRCRRSFVV